MENELLRPRSIRNPELTRFALENIRLLEQLRLFQNFYEQGERETLLSEVSQLRNKLLEALETQESYDQSKFLSRRDEQDKLEMRLSLSPACAGIRKTNERKGPAKYSNVVGETNELWNRLKVQSFAKTVLSIWSMTALSLYIRVQVNILGRHLYIDTARGLGAAHLLVCQLRVFFTLII
ncbi:hypothetical protein POM88_029153 [Heracleum sosnowskyi]|uniref:Uncharacterized protein n=1 Tax=Heracleum sosnowskyi TaxID=360622 RepID=A0AAD8MEM1_9APIA|nr:hypothetical protein POM88_029153 [Heracleum sosnowskyi]